MWTWIITLPLVWQITLPIVFMLLVTVLGLYGKVWFSIGKNKIGIGGDKASKKRSCLDCSKLHRAESARVNRKIIMIESTLMRDKMNVAEQKLLELRGAVYKAASHKLKEEGVTDDDLLNLTTRLKLAFKNTLKDEIRRSIKENGFHDKDGREFDDYVDDQKNAIIHLIEEEFLTYYDADCIAAVLLQVDSKISACVRDIYTNAKEVETDAVANINKLEAEYDEQIDAFIGITKE